MWVLCDFVLDILCVFDECIISVTCGLFGGFYFGLLWLLFVFYVCFFRVLVWVLFVLYLASIWFLCGFHSG